MAKVSQVGLQRQELHKPLKILSGKIFLEWYSQIVRVLKNHSNNNPRAIKMELIKDQLGEHQL
jgi:hypothetical protein